MLVRGNVEERDYVLAYNIEKTPGLHTIVAFMNLKQARLQHVELKSEQMCSSAVTFLEPCARIMSYTLEAVQESDSSLLSMLRSGSFQERFLE